MDSIFKLLQDFNFFQKEDIQKSQNKSSLEKLIEHITFSGGIYIKCDGFDILFQIPEKSIANEETYLRKCRDVFKLHGLVLKIKKI